MKTFWKFKNFSGPHIIVYSLRESHFEQNIAVLSESGVKFLNMSLHDHHGKDSRVKITRAWWWKGDHLCVMSTGTKIRHIVHIWSPDLQTVVHRIIGKRVWSKFRGRHAKDISYPVCSESPKGCFKVDLFGPLRCLAPDNVVRRVHYDSVDGNLYWGHIFIPEAPLHTGSTAMDRRRENTGPREPG